MKGHHRVVLVASITAAASAAILVLYDQSQLSSLEAAGLKSPLIEKVPKTNPIPCDIDHFPCDPSSIFPDPRAAEIAWNHRYIREMTIPRGLGYYHIKGSDEMGQAADSRIWGQLGPSKDSVKPFVDGNSIPHGIGYYPDEIAASAEDSQDALRVPLAEKTDEDFIPLNLGYYASEVPARLEDTDGFDSTQSYMRDPTFYGDAFRSAYPFDPESRPNFYPTAGP